MKLLYGTGNQAKVSVMKNRLKDLGIELLSLNDMKAAGKEIPEVSETGGTPLENARIKAQAYYDAFQMPVFSCDSGLYFENVPSEVQPGVHVRTIQGKCLSDEEMVAYYTGLANTYGNLTARYQNAICLILEETKSYEAMDPSMASRPFILSAKPHGPIREKGFPLDSMSIDVNTGKYYYDLSETELKRFAVEDTFLVFFQNILKQEKL